MSSSEEESKSKKRKALDTSPSKPKKKTRKIVDSSSEEEVKKTTIANVKRTQKTKKSRSGVGTIKHEEITVRSLIRFAYPEIEKEYLNGLANVSWLQNVSEPNLPEMITTIVKNIKSAPLIPEANDSPEEVALRERQIELRHSFIDSIVTACKESETYREIYWQFPSMLSFYLEHRKRVDEQFKKVIGAKTGRKCKKCGEDSWRITTVQTRSADEATTVIKECTICGK